MRGRNVGGGNERNEAEPAAGVVEERAGRNALPPHQSQDDGVNDEVPVPVIAIKDAASVVVTPPPPPPPAPAGEEDTSKIYFEKHEGKSCQNYLHDDAAEHPYQEAKALCLADVMCNAIVCPHNKESMCTLRGVPNLVPYAPEDCYKKVDPDDAASEIHPDYQM